MLADLTSPGMQPTVPPLPSFDLLTAGPCRLHPDCTLTRVVNWAQYCGLADEWVCPPSRLDGSWAPFFSSVVNLCYPRAAMQGNVCMFGHKPRNTEP
jgi:hypothetical protein